MDYKYKILLLLFPYIFYGQNTLSGYVFDQLSKNPIEGVQIINKETNEFLATTNNEGYYSFNTSLNSVDIIYFDENYEKINYLINFLSSSEENDVEMVLISTNLDEIELLDNKDNSFQIEYIDDISGNTILSGKKNEIIFTDNKPGKNLNNARQMYNQTVSLNIYQTDDSGLQLNIGGRGLDPRRTSNFNVRQNGYDISADPLGYPESYYIPPFQCLEKIQLIRGAASLQYGTQFGGMINFIIKKPNPNKRIELIQSNSIGSNNFFNNFTSFSGTIKSLGYYAYYNKKKGSGFRPNSDFNSDNLYTYISYIINEKLNLSTEITYLKYLAQQPGGLTDEMFNYNIYQSNRERNWFQIKWFLYNFKISYDFSEKTKMTFNFFTLNASRNSIGFRSNRVDQIDSFEERDLIKANFNNIGFEFRLLHEYNFLNKRNSILLGYKLYSGKNMNKQGPGSNDYDSNFSLQSDFYPNYEYQSKYTNPNLNFSFFGEQIIHINKKMKLTPGFRFEYIETNSEGFYRNINEDQAGNIILNEIIYTEESRDRSFILFGLGYNYNLSKWIDFYSNISKNYRAVTFADINIINPNFIINPNIIDENGYTVDFGIRGNYNEYVFYDISTFYLSYNDRIGFIQKAFADGSVKNEKGNVGDALIFGNEFLFNFNLKKLIKLNLSNFNYYVNYSLTSSEYIYSDENGISGNNVEFVPKSNLKTGLQLGFNNLNFNVQYTYMSSQFTDATNSIESDLSGVIGLIPSYDILDLSLLFSMNNTMIELGVNNLLNEHYFTNRATGYPGPGIIPSPVRNYYFILEYKF